MKHKIELINNREKSIQTRSSSINCYMYIKKTNKIIFIALVIFNIAGCEIQKEKEFVMNEIFRSGNLVSINLPKSEEIINIEFNGLPLNISDTKLSEEDFKDLFNNANVISPDDPILKKWHYAPWYTGSFKTKDGTYKFELYLGGLGFLTNPKNEVGAFLLKL